MDDTVARTGLAHKADLKASLKAAHTAHKASLKAKIAAHKAQKKGYTPVDDTVERVGLKAALKAEIAAHKASIKAKAAAHKAHKAHKKGNWIYWFHFIDVKILLVNITFTECPILAMSFHIFFLF